MWDIKACIVCFRTSTKLYHLNLGREDLRRDFNLLSGLKTSRADGLPEYLCFECKAYVHKFRRFRERCQRANFVCREILNKKKQILPIHIDALNKEAIGVTSPIQLFNPESYKYKEYKFKWVESIRPPEIPFTCPIVSFNLGSEGLETTLHEEVHIKVENLEVVKEDEDIIEDDNEIEDVFHNDNDGMKYESDDANIKEDQNEADGQKLNHVYGTMVPITIVEAKAAYDVRVSFLNGDFKCTECGRCFLNQTLLNVHSNMHDKHARGTFCYEICKNCYRTDFLYQTHMTDKHNYKYLCTECNEVSFDRQSAKQHYKTLHWKPRNPNAPKPDWLDNRGGKRSRVKLPKRMPKSKKIKTVKDEADFPEIIVIPQPEQYSMIEERKLSRNYLESELRCHLCYKGFRENVTFETHMKKHDPEIAGPCICDMCKRCFKNPRQMYKHMTVSHLFKFKCRFCDDISFSRSTAYSHYRTHKNVTFNCPHCDLVFKKPTTAMTHIRIKHPSSIVCVLCGHSFVSEQGIYFHMRRSHTKEERELSENMKLDRESDLYCADCDLQFVNQPAFKTHLGSSSKHVQINHSSQPKHKYRRKETSTAGRVSKVTGLVLEKRRRRHREESEVLNTGAVCSNTCEECGEVLKNDRHASKHYQEKHPGVEFLRRYMCDVCGHTTKQYANLVVHMRTHTNEKPYSCPHCDRTFSMQSNRDRHIVVHTGEKRFECHHCNRRFTQSSAVKLHIQTVHMKIPYPPWDKANRKRRQKLENQEPLPEPKVMVETAGQYINAYISYDAHD